MTDVNIATGTRHVLFAYDIGLSINLDQAERRLATTARRDSIKYKRRAPRFENRRPPLRQSMMVEPIAVAEWRTEPNVDLVIYDFGAVSAAYRIPLRGSIEALLPLSDALYDHASLLAESRRTVEQLAAAIGPAIHRPLLSDLVEDYVIYEIDELSPASTPDEMLQEHGALLTQILRSEREALSAEEMSDALSYRVSYSANDLAILDWNASLLLHGDVEDVLAVLEYANVELLEMRYLDDQLDSALDDAYDVFSKHRWGRLQALRSRAADLRRVAEMQIDSALLFEGVNNALRLLGDQYLARAYRTAAKRLHLPEWDISIIRKLNTLESIYQKLADQRSARRMELLEWIIILLIAAEIAISFMPSVFGPR